MPITALPPAPSREDPANFADEADAWVAALANFVTEANSLQTDVNDKQTQAATSADTAQNAADTAVAASIAAVSASNATAWNNSTVYPAGSVVWSLINYQSYRRKNNGSGGVDPSLDGGVNWASLGGGGSGADYLLLNLGVI